MWNEKEKESVITSNVSPDHSIVEFNSRERRRWIYPIYVHKTVWDLQGSEQEYMKRKENQGLSPGSFQQFKKKKILVIRKIPFRRLRRKNQLSRGKLNLMAESGAWKCSSLLNYEDRSRAMMMKGWPLLGQWEWKPAFSGPRENKRKLNRTG